MAEATTTETKPVIKQPENPLILTPERNKIALPFTEQVTTRGKTPGKTLFNPDITDPQKFLDWIGLENVVSICKAKVRGLTLGWVDEATDDETDEFIANKFLQFASEFSARGETIGELEEQREDAQSDLVKLDLSKSDAETTKKFLELGVMIQKLTIAITQKQRPRKVKTATATAAA